MANIIQEALNALHPQKIISPLPSDQTLNTPHNLGLAQQVQSDLSQFWPAIIKKLKQGQPGGEHTMNDIKSALSQIGGKTQGVQAQVSPTQTPTPTPTIDPATPLPTGTAAAMNYINSQVPAGQDPTQYYPALQDKDFMDGINQAEQQKPGLGNVLLLNAFNESTLGRSKNGNNLFGELPGGEGSGKQASFPSYRAALDYTLGSNMLSGGGNPNMNIMNEPGPLTHGRMDRLMSSWNPEGVYVNTLHQVLAPH